MVTLLGRWHAELRILSELLAVEDELEAVLSARGRAEEAGRLPVPMFESLLRRKPLPFGTGEQLTESQRDRIKKALRRLDRWPGPGRLPVKTAAKDITGSLCGVSGNEVQRVLDDYVRESRGALRNRHST